MSYERFPMIGKPTVEEASFTNFLLDGIAHYVSQRPTDRRVLIAAICRISMIIFCEQTPLTVKEQCQEIDDFCTFLKNHSMRDSVRS